MYKRQAKAGLMDKSARDLCGAGLKRVCELADIPPDVYKRQTGCILGHNFPISMEFRGGKGIAASVGMIIAFDWRIFIVCAVVFFALFFTTHYVSLCSCLLYTSNFVPENWEK